MATKRPRGRRAAWGHDRTPAAAGGSRPEVPALSGISHVATLCPPEPSIYSRASHRRVRAAVSMAVRSGGTTGRRQAPGANPGCVPVARIGRASPSAHPAGRQPTVDPVQARFARRSAAGFVCGPPARHAREVLGRSGRRLALVAGILLATPAGAHATPPGGVRSPASASSAAAPSATPPSATVAAVGRPVVESITCRTGCLDISTSTAGSIVRVTGEDAGSAASIVLLGRRGARDDRTVAARPIGPAVAEATLPAGARGGPVRLVTVDGRRSLRSRDGDGDPRPGPAPATDRRAGGQPPGARRRRATTRASTCSWAPTARPTSSSTSSGQPTAR